MPLTTAVLLLAGGDFDVRRMLIDATRLGRNRAALILAHRPTSFPRALSPEVNYDPITFLASTALLLFSSHTQI